MQVTNKTKAQDQARDTKMRKPRATEGDDDKMDSKKTRTYKRELKRYDGSDWSERYDHEEERKEKKCHQSRPCAKKKTCEALQMRAKQERA